MGRKKVKTILIDDPVFSSSILVQRGGTAQSLSDRYAKEIGVEPMILRESIGRKGITLYYDGHKNAAIWLADDAGLGTVSHEAAHATFWILGFSGFKLSDESEEAYAYYLQFIVNEIVKGLFGWK